MPFFVCISPKSQEFSRIRQYRQALRLKIAEFWRLAIYRQLKFSIAKEKPKIADLAIYRQKWQHCVSFRSVYCIVYYCWLLSLFLAQLLFIARSRALEALTRVGKPLTFGPFGFIFIILGDCYCSAMKRAHGALKSADKVNNNKKTEKNTSKSKSKSSWVKEKAKKISKNWDRIQGK